MTYDAITIDTNIFRENGYKFNIGILAKLDQFKTSSSQLIISRIVIGEIKNHLIENIRDARDTHQKALENLIRHTAINSRTLNKINELIAAETTPESVVNNIFDAFIERTGAIVVEPGSVDIEELIDCYFDTLPPFEKKADKKNEFPDAIALLSLEEWAKENNKRILAVSKDEGWARYAEQSDRISINRNLPVSLEIMINREEFERNLIKKFLEEVEDNKTSDEAKFIEERVKQAVQDIEADIEANTDYALIEPEGISIEYKKFNFAKILGELDFHVIRREENEVTISADIEIEANLEGSFSLFAWDSIDREYVNLTSTASTIEETFDASLLITFIIDLQTSECKIHDVELTNTPNSFDFGFVEPDSSFYE